MNKQNPLVAASRSAAAAATRYEMGASHRIFLTERVHVRPNTD